MDRHVIHTQTCRGKSRGKNKQEKSKRKAGAGNVLQRSLKTKLRKSEHIKKALSIKRRLIGNTLSENTELIYLDLQPTRMSRKRPNET